MSLIKNLVPWREDPMRTLSSLQRDMNSILEDFFKPGVTDLGIAEARFMPKVSVLQDDGTITVEAELPGMTAKDIEMTLTGDILTIKGEKKQEKTETKKDFIHRECSYGSFMRQLQLPVEVDNKGIEATFKDGILHVDLPKTEKAKASKRAIPIRAAR